jgi:RNA polymerase sigma factor (TIGR02999 family)
MESSATPELGDVTRLLRDLNADRAGTLEDLLPLLYDDLRRVARMQRGRHSAGETLRTTALINEAFLKLRGSNSLSAENRLHFLRVAASAMRQIIIDYARARTTQKRGAETSSTDSMPDVADPLAVEAEQLLAIDTALKRLEQLSPRLAQLVDCRFFAGYTEEETAQILGVTDRTVRRDWIKAKAFLTVELGLDDLD